MQARMTVNVYAIAWTGSSSMQLSPSGSNTRVARPPSLTVIRSRRRDPNPRLLGCPTGGPPCSVHSIYQLSCMVSGYPPPDKDLARFI